MTDPDDVVGKALREIKRVHEAGHAYDSGVCGYGADLGDCPESNYCLACAVQRLDLDALLAEHERELREAPSRSRNVIAWTNAQLKVIEEMCEDRIRNPSAFKPLAPSWLRGECERIRGMLTAELHPAHRAGGDDAA